MRGELPVAGEVALGKDKLPRSESNSTSASCVPWQTLAG